MTVILPVAVSTQQPKSTVAFPLDAGNWLILAVAVWSYAPFGRFDRPRSVIIIVIAAWMLLSSVSARSAKLTYSSKPAVIVVLPAA
ncbi:hypothetical protein ES703_99655 [subsurface metagenome]